MELTIGLCDPASDSVAGLEPLPGVQLRRVVKFADNALWRMPVDGNEAPSHSTPSEYVCLAATTTEGAALANRIAADVAAATGIELPVADLVEMTKPNRRKAVYDLCVRALAGRATRAERRVGQLAEALATLRREHESILQRFAEIEAGVVLQGHQPVQTLCAQKDVEAFAELGETARLGRHAALDLPFGTLGLYLLSLFIDAENAEGALDISIETRGAPRALARWTHEFRNDKAAWQTWTRQLALTEAYSAARLVLTFKGKGSIRIGMGSHHPARRVWLVGANGQTEQRHIAMRALATTPGLRAPESAASGGNVKRLWDIESAVQIAPSSDDIPALVSSAPEGGVMVTPVMGMVTAAGLGQVMPKGATAVRAMGVVAHADGPLVDFALLAGNADTIRDMIETDQLELSDGFPGWVTGAALSPVLLALVLPHAATGEEELVLLTRISAESTHDWCARAIFRDVQILMDQEIRHAG